LIYLKRPLLDVRKVLPSAVISPFGNLRSGAGRYDLPPYRPALFPSQLAPGDRPEQSSGAFSLRMPGVDLWKR
jgi:hypothetical protein